MMILPTINYVVNENCNFVISNYLKFRSFSLSLSSSFWWEKERMRDGVEGVEFEVLTEGGKTYSKKKKDFSWALCKYVQLENQYRGGHWFICSLAGCHWCDTPLSSIYTNFKLNSFLTPHIEPILGVRHWKVYFFSLHNMFEIHP